MIERNRLLQLASRSGLSLRVRSVFAIQRVTAQLMKMLGVAGQLIRLVIGLLDVLCTADPRRMKPIIAVVLTGVLVSALAPAAQAQSSSEPASHSHEMALHTPGKIEWKAGPPSLPTGAKFAVLEGDPTKEGPFVMRLQVPDGYHIPPHTHPKTERVTIIAGGFYVAMGDDLQRSKATKLEAGSYGFWPAGMKHAAWTEGPTIIQLHGTGPWTINYVNPADDPRNGKKTE
ncbi:MAG TPA: cupin domain-containing protein [Chthoniobacterales bacterium]|nr:cupin domain-containing protein [Chthoniobacterales bacterium]